MMKKKGRSLRLMLVVFLLLISGGAIVNVAVAWGQCIELTRERFGIFVSPSPAAPPLGTREIILEWQYGFPAYTLSDVRVEEDAPVWHIESPRWLVGGSGVDLPLRPIWPGFAINTIFYAAILWLIFALPGKARRYFRIKRGLCPACAYPVGSSNVCTECGNTLDKMKLKSREGVGLPPAPQATPAKEL